MKGLYVAVAVTMAAVAAVFALFAEIEQRYGLSTNSLGLIAGAAFGASLVTQLTLSRYADRGYGAVLLRVGMAAGTVGLFWFAAATEVWQFVLARALLGASVGMIMPPARRAVIATAEGNAGERLGVLYAFFLAGFVTGPPIAGVLTTIGDVRLPFVVFGVIMAVVSVASTLRLRIPEAPRTAVGAPVVDKRVLRRLIRIRRVIAALLVILSFRFSVGVFEPLWAVHLDALGASTLTVSLSLTLFAAPMLIVAKQAGRLSDRIGPRFASVVSAFATVPLMASYGVFESLPVVFALCIPHGLLEAVQSPGTQAAMAEAAPAEDTASAQGLGEAGGSLAAMIGALAAAPIYDAWGALVAWVLAALAMAALLTTSVLLDRPVRRVRPAPATSGVPSAL
jgi:DHA1 family multidrug resistance protein-like MFS transporter